MLLDGKECIHEANQVCMGIFLEVFGQNFAGHPFRYELGGVAGDAPEGYNIRVIEVLPHHSLPAKILPSLSGCKNQPKIVRAGCLINWQLIPVGVCPKPFDTYICPAKGPFIDVTESTIFDRLLAE